MKNRSWIKNIKNIKDIDINRFCICRVSKLILFMVKRDFNLLKEDYEEMNIKYIDLGNIML